MVKILITGGSGAIGSMIARECVKQGHEAVLYSRAPSYKRIRDIQNDVKLVQGDILDSDSFVEALRKNQIEYIVHAAAILPIKGETDPYLAVKVNVEGTAAVLEAAVLANVKRVLIASNKGVYRDYEGKHSFPYYEPVPEDYPKIMPGTNHTMYNVTKYCAELIAMKYHELKGVETIIFRFATTYGPGKENESHGSSRATVSRMIENAYWGEETVIPQGGDEKTDYVYFGDIARAVLLALQSNNIKKRIYNIGSGQGYTLKDVAGVLRRIYPDRKIEVGDGNDFMQLGMNPYCVLDIRAAQEDFGYEPAYSLEKGIKEYINLLEKAFKGER
jgi:nucleoside-diphosphate-sugar epimerase